MGNKRNIANNYIECNQKIYACHEGNHHFSHFCDTGDTTKDYQCGQSSNNTTNNSSIYTKSIGARNCNGVRLYGVKNQTVSYRNQYCKEYCHGLVAQYIFNVVSRTAQETATLTGHFVDLAKSTFHKTGSTTNQSNKPHPENCTGTASYNCDSYASNITNAYARSSRNAERLERRNTAFTNFGACSFSNQAHHFFNATNLHKTTTNSKPSTQTNQHGNKNVGPQPTVESINNVRNKFHFYPPLNLLNSLQRNFNEFAAFSF